MELDIAVHLDYAVNAPVDLLLQIEAASLDDQQIVSREIDYGWAREESRIAAESGIGERTWLHVDRDFICNYNARVAVTRSTPDLAGLPQVMPRHLSGEAVRYLMPSRYCPSDVFQAFVATEFGATEGGARVMALRDWIEQRFAYVPGASDGSTTALETFVQRQGVCRDFAHVLVAMARASTIPARFASVYAPDVNPQDFHAVAEVYLDGEWHLVDPTGMAGADTIAVVGVGADAADVSFMTSFGPMMLRQQSVSVSRVSS
jgi:transglutaminase-like putative cysteine protease